MRRRAVLLPPFPDRHERSFQLAGEARRIEQRMGGAVGGELAPERGKGRGSRASFSAKAS